MTVMAGADPLQVPMVVLSLVPWQMVAISGNKTPDNKQGELDGELKAMGYTSAQVFKF